MTLRNPSVWRNRCRRLVSSMERISRKAALKISLKQAARMEVSISVHERVTHVASRNEEARRLVDRCRCGESVGPGNAALSSFVDGVVHRALVPSSRGRSMAAGVCVRVPPIDLSMSRKPMRAYRPHDKKGLPSKALSSLVWTE